jgi:hypothetical protein
MSSNKFKAGDIVVLKSNPYTEMTVSSIGPSLEFARGSQRLEPIGPVQLEAVWLGMNEEPRKLIAAPECFDWPVNDDEEEDDEDELEDELDFDPDEVED